MDIEKLYNMYMYADKSDKPGIAKVLESITYSGYIDSRVGLASTIKTAMVDAYGLDTTADTADFIAGRVLQANL